MASNVTGRTRSTVEEAVQGYQTAAGYVEMLQRAYLLTEGPHLCGDDWVFQQDNAADRSLTKESLQENDITLLDHPAFSPDLNPIENVLGWMSVPDRGCPS